MKITATKKIVPEDFSSEERSFIKKIAMIYNPLVEQLSSILNSGLLLGDNFKSRIISFELESGVSTYKPSWEGYAKPSAVLIGKITTGATPNTTTHITQNVSLSWLYTYDSFSKPILDIKFIGLASAKHQITLVALG